MIRLQVADGKGRDVVPACVPSRPRFPAPPTSRSLSRHITHPAERIRAVIRQQFHNFGASEDVQTEETILISDGYYCGRRFRCDGFEAVWFIEENQIKFFDQDGTVRLTQSATTILSDDEGRRAA